MRFVMVDRILSLEPGKNIVAAKTLDPSEELFRDHFPGFPVVPGVLLTEMMAQAGGKCLYAQAPERGYPVLIRVKDASFRSWAAPGKEIQIHAEVTSSSGSYAVVRARASVDGKKICSSELSYSFVSPDTFGIPSSIPDIFSLESSDHEN